jgi:hypothetical protein
MRIEYLYRYPVKGLTAEALDSASNWNGPPCVSETMSKQEPGFGGECVITLTETRLWPAQLTIPPRPRDTRLRRARLS